MRHRPASTRDAGLDLGGGAAEGRRTLAGVEDAETSTRASADVEEPSARPQRSHDGGRGSGDSGQRGANRTDGDNVLVM
jgi:hypothetical protein